MAAAAVLQHLDPLRQPLSQLAAGALAGDWEGALELVGRLGDALRQVRHTVLLAAAAGGCGQARVHVLPVELRHCCLQVWPLKVPPAAWVYPQARMQHVLLLAGRSFAAYVQVGAHPVACSACVGCPLDSQACRACHQPAVVVGRAPLMGHQ